MFSVLGIPRNSRNQGECRGGPKASVTLRDRSNMAGLARASQDQLCVSVRNRLRRVTVHAGVPCRQVIGFGILTACDHAQVAGSQVGRSGSPPRARGADWARWAVSFPHELSRTPSPLPWRAQARRLVSALGRNGVLRLPPVFTRPAAPAAGSWQAQIVDLACWPFWGFPGPGSDVRSTIALDVLRRLRLTLSLQAPRRLIRLGQ